MGFWKTAALSAALLGAAGVGAAMTPTTTAQTSTRVVTPRGFEVFGAGGSRIGVTVADLDTDSKETGVRVDSVEDDSPAAKAGLKRGTWWSSSMVSAFAASASSRVSSPRPRQAARFRPR